MFVTVLGEEKVDLINFDTRSLHSFGGFGLTYLFF